MVLTFLLVGMRPVLQPTVWLSFWPRKSMERLLGPVVLARRPTVAVVLRVRPVPPVKWPRPVPPPQVWPVPLPFPLVVVLPSVNRHPDVVPFHLPSRLLSVFVVPERPDNLALVFPLLVRRLVPPWGVVPLPYPAVARTLLRRQELHPLVGRVLRDEPPQDRLVVRPLVGLRPPRVFQG